MKKILSLALILFLTAQICFATEESEEDIDSYFQEEPEQSTQLNGYLEYNQKAEEQKEENAIELNTKGTVGINISKPQKVNSKSLLSNYKAPNFNPIQDKIDAISSLVNKDYDIRPVSTSYSKNVGKFSFGTTYNSFIDSARTNYSTTVFTKYEGKRFALSTAFSKSADNNSTNNMNYTNDTFYIAPELKLTKRLSLLNVMQTDVEQINKKNEVVLRYTPHFKKYADDVQFEIGAGQSFYNDTYTESTLRFSTKFKL